MSIDNTGESENFTYIIMMKHRPTLHLSELNYVILQMTNRYRCSYYTRNVDRSGVWCFLPLMTYLTDEYDVTDDIVE